jgi:superfamily II DNA or RNA helicase
MINIYIENPVWSHVVSEYVPAVLPILSYKSFKWEYNWKLRRKVQKKTVVPLIDQSGYFNTGLIARLTDSLQQSGIPFKVFYAGSESAGKMSAYITNGPQIGGFEGFIDFHDHQRMLIDAAIEHERGCLVSATASGKTLVAAGIISCFRDFKFLFLVNTKTLARQAFADFTKYGFSKIQLLYEGEKIVDEDAQIVVATRQSYVILDMSKYTDHFDGVFVDEVHHTPDAYAENLQIMNHLMCPLRFGLSATYPSDLQQQMCIEAAIGPVIGEFTVEEAIEKGIVAKPIIKLFKTDYHDNIRTLTRWKDVEKKGIVENLSRNRQIMRITKDYMDQGLSVLILIRMIEHGENLMEIARKIRMDAHFIHGETEIEMREQMRAAMNRKDIKCIIASTIWKEGVDIPSLDVVMIADGGMKEGATMQKIGRGLRKTGEKDTVIIVDFFDPSHEYLIKHFGYRCTFYFEKGWL